MIGIDWAIRQEESEYRGGILADDVGLGKTVEMIALICQNRAPEDNDRRPTLILVPLGRSARRSCLVCILMRTHSSPSWTMEPRDSRVVRRYCSKSACLSRPFKRGNNWRGESDGIMVGSTAQPDTLLSENTLVLGTIRRRPQYA